MNKYETIFLMKSDITEEQKNKVIDNIKNYLTTNGKIAKTEDLGLKTLAYEIKTYKQAYYYLIEFDAKYEAISELERIYRINNDILKFIVVRKEGTENE